LAGLGKQPSDRLTRRKIGLVHYFPVWLFLDEQVPDFDIGPVRFCSRESWIREVEKRHGQRSQWMDDVLLVWTGRKSADDIPVRYCFIKSAVRSDQWVACVTINGFEEEESYRRALLATRTALDTLRLVVPAPENHRICAAADHGPPMTVDHLSQLEHLDLRYGVSTDRRGISGPPGMANNIVAKSLTLRDATGQRIAVSLAANPSTVPCRSLSERWINAMHWYGRGCTDYEDFGAVVNFAISMDILSGGLMEPGIRELAARLLQIPFSRQVSPDGATLKTLVSRIYDYRSKITHGSILALDERLRTERVAAESLASVMLANYVIELDKYASSGGSDDRDDFRNSLPPVPGP
jgi:hypothetical protein